MLVAETGPIVNKEVCDSFDVIVELFSQRFIAISEGQILKHVGFAAREFHLEVLVLDLVHSVTANCLSDDQRLSK